MEGLFARAALGALFGVSLVGLSSLESARAQAEPSSSVILMGRDERREPCSIRFVPLANGFVGRFDIQGDLYFVTLSSDDLRAGRFTARIMGGNRAEGYHQTTLDSVSVGQFGLSEVSGRMDRRSYILSIGRGRLRGGFDHPDELVCRNLDVP